MDFALVSLNVTDLVLSGLTQSPELKGVVAASPVMDSVHSVPPQPLISAATNLSSGAYPLRKSSSRSQAPSLLPTPRRSNEPEPRPSRRTYTTLANAVVANYQVLATRQATSRLIGQPTNDSLQSLDVSMPGRQKKHLSMSELRAMKGSSLLELLSKDRNGEFRSKLRDVFAKGLSKNSCHALDLAGKVPFSLLMHSIGVNHHDLWVDSAHSGGLFDTADAFIPSIKAFLEIKSAKLKAGSKQQFQMKKIKHLGTSWRYLVFICRAEQPDDWLDTAEHKRRGFWIGVIDRNTYIAQLKANNKYHLQQINLTVTPGTGTASAGGKSRSWIGNYIKWTKFNDVVDASWWREAFPSA